MTQTNVNRLQPSIRNHAPLRTEPRHSLSDYACERLRGEQLDQKRKHTYSFRSCTTVGNLVALHGERAIVVQIDIGGSGPHDSDWPSLDPERSQLARRILQHLRSHLVGPWASLRRIAGRHYPCLSVEGPFIPHQIGAANLVLVVRINRDGNYDDTHERVRRFLESHPDNDDRHSASGAKATDPASKHHWTTAELHAVEEMARLESPEGPLDDRSLAMRRDYNWRILEKLRGADAEIDRFSSPAALAADEILQRFFYG